MQWGRLTLFRVSGTATDAARVACLLEDITQQRQSALAQRQALSQPQPEVLPQFPAIPVEQLGGMFDQVLSCTADLLLICDRTGECLYINRATARTLGIAQQECVGKPWQQLPLPAEAIEPIERSWQHVLETGDCTNEEISLSSDEGWRDYDCAIAPLAEREGEFPAIFISAKDITAQKRAIAAATESLVKEQELNALQAHFARVVSHELRNPLNNIYSCAKLVENHAQRWTEEKKGSYLNRIQVNVKRINQLLDDLLLMQRVEAGELKLQLALVDLDEFCRELIAEIKEGAGADYRITFVSQNQRVGIWDEKLLRQILTNLLLNAIKYSPKGSEVKLSLISQSESVVFSVQDAGIGIPEAQLERIFEPFHRCSNVGNVNGSGLGLSIVKQCVALHGGEITVESTAGKGTTFTVTLPLHQRRAIGG
jgi:PAS domain S-box-containing protein